MRHRGSDLALFAFVLLAATAGDAAGQPSPTVALLIEGSGADTAALEVALREGLVAQGGVVVAPEEARAARAFVAPDPSAPLTSAQSGQLRESLGVPRLLVVMLRPALEGKVFVAMHSVEAASPRPQFAELAPEAIAAEVVRWAVALPAVGAAPPAAPPSVSVPSAGTAAPPPPSRPPPIPAPRSEARAAAPSAGAAAAVREQVRAGEPEVDLQVLIDLSFAVTGKGELGFGGVDRLSIPIAPGAASRHRVALEVGLGYLYDITQKVFILQGPVTAALRSKVGRIELALRAGAAAWFTATTRPYADPAIGIVPVASAGLVAPYGSGGGALHFEVGGALTAGPVLQLGFGIAR